MPKVTVPMTQKEWEMLKELAKRDGRSMASWIRRGVGEGSGALPRHREVTHGH